eukprot:28633-Hanusia_phi.AAC.1
MQKTKLRAKMRQIAGVQALQQFDQQLRQQGLGNLDTENNAADTETEHKQNNNYLSSLPGRMSNEQLAHELLLDPTFKLNEREAGYIESPVLLNVRDAFKRAFWDSLVDDLKLNPPCYTRVLKVVGEVRDGMIDLAPARKDQFLEKFDTSYWQDQIDRGLLDWVSCVSLMKAMVALELEMQEPTRREETQTTWATLQDQLSDCPPQQQPTAFCKALEYVLDRLNVMRVDAANSRLRNIAQVIQDHGVEYEMAFMQKKTQSNPGYLKRTPEWIREVMEQEVKKRRINPSKLIQGDANEYQRFHASAVLSLVTASEPVTPDNCPETLLLDISRLQKHHLHFHFDTLGAALLAIVSQRLPMLLQIKIGATAAADARAH